MTREEIAARALQAIIASGQTIVALGADGKRLSKYDAAAEEAMQYAYALDRALPRAMPETRDREIEYARF